MKWLQTICANLHKIMFSNNELCIKENYKNKESTILYTNFKNMRRKHETCKLIFTGIQTGEWEITQYKVRLNVSKHSKTRIYSFRLGINFIFSDHFITGLFS